MAVMIEYCYTKVIGKVDEGESEIIPFKFRPRALMNMKIVLLTKDHNSYPWEFLRTIGRPDHQQLQRYRL
jgi:hypothetical protein